MKATASTNSQKSNSQLPAKNDQGTAHQTTGLSKKARKRLRRQANMEDGANEEIEKVQAPAISRSQTPETVKLKKKKQAGVMPTFSNTHPEQGRDRTLSEAAGRSQNAEKLQRTGYFGSQLGFANAESRQFRGGQRGRGFRGGRGQGRGRGGGRGGGPQ